MSIQIHTVSFDASLEVITFSHFSGHLLVVNGEATVTREVYGRVYYNDNAAPEGMIIRGITADTIPVNYTLIDGISTTIGTETWYRLVLLGETDTQILTNATFSKLLGSEIAYWPSSTPAFVSRESQIVQFGSEYFQHLYVAKIDTSLAGSAPPSEYLQQTLDVNTDLKEQTTYTATVLCRAIAPSVGRIVALNDTSYVYGTSTSIGEFERLQVTFTTGIAPHSVVIYLELFVGQVCEFAAVNISEGTQVGFAQGQTVLLARYLNPNYANAEDAAGTLISFPFIPGSGYHENGASRVDIYFNEPITTISPLGGTYADRPTITISVEEEPASNVSIYYRINNAPYILYTMPFVIPQDGAVILDWYGVDLQGNTSAVQTETYFITAPTVSAVPVGGPNASNAKLLGSIQYISFDTNTRAGTVYYTTDGSNPVPAGPSTNEFYVRSLDPIVAAPDGEAWLSGRLLLPIEIGTQGITELRYQFEDLYGSFTAIQSDWYEINTQRPIIESFIINEGSIYPTQTNDPVVRLSFALGSAIPIDKLQITTSATTVPLSVLNAGHPEVQAMFTGAPFLAPREVIEYSLTHKIPYVSSPGLNQYAVYARAHTTDPSSTTEFSPLVLAWIWVDIRIPSLVINSNVDRNGDSPAEISHYNTFTLEGEKDDGAKLILRVNSVEEELSIALSATSWTYDVVLPLGYNEIELFAENALGTRSEPYAFDVTVVVPPGVVDAATLIDVFGRWSIPFIFFDKGAHEIPYHTFRLHATTDTGVLPVITSVVNEELVGQEVITISGVAPATASIVYLSVERVR